MIGFGQNVNIPDANFKAYLVGNTAINTSLDNEIQVGEAATFNGMITCSSLNISDLTGIETFTNLTSLVCPNNPLTTIDVSNNPALYSLNLDNTPLTTLDVSNNTALATLQCSNNQLTALDVSNNPALYYLDCEGNLLTTLDVSNNPALIYLNCNLNQLICLDISANINLEEFFCTNNLLEQLNTKNGNWTNLYLTGVNNSLTCVEVDNIGYANTNWSNLFDNFVTFSTNCNYANPCWTTSVIEEHTTNKELLKVTDLLGREIKQTNQPLFYFYNDGTVEKRIVIE
jgi:hypothetical protein